MGNALELPPALLGEVTLELEVNEKTGCCEKSNLAGGLKSGCGAAEGAWNKLNVPALAPKGLGCCVGAGEGKEKASCGRCCSEAGCWLKEKALGVWNALCEAGNVKAGCAWNALFGCGNAGCLGNCCCEEKSKFCA